LWKRDRSNRGAELVNKASEIFCRLSDQEPKSVELRWFATRSHQMVGQVALDQKRYDKADEEFRQAGLAIEGLVSEYSGVVRYSVLRLDNVVSRGLVQLGLGRAADAEALLRAAIRFGLENRAGESNQHARMRFGLANAHIELWRLLNGSGREADAERLIDEAASTKGMPAIVLSSLARAPVRERQGNGRDFEKIINLARRAAESEAGDAEPLIALAEILMRAGRANEALVILKRASELSSTFSAEVSLLNVLTYLRLAESDAATRCWVEVQNWIEANGTIDPDVQRLHTEARELVGPPAK
jgi:tetratricopeptide (TPR) repeat protein